MAENIRITHVRKRDGQLQPFDSTKIFDAVRKAFDATNTADGNAVQKITERVVKELNEGWAGRTPGVEDIQDVVERALMDAGYAEVAKAYILYRRERTQVREAKRLIGVIDDLKLGVNAVSVLKRRYLLRDDQGNVIETPSQLFRRVAHTVAQPDANYGATETEIQQVEEEFYRIMTEREFLPNSPTLMNAGTDICQLSACFVLPIEDSIESIFETLKHAALIHKTGGGTGFSFSRIRPRNDIVSTTKGAASGPISFMRIYNMATEIVKQGGRRRGANMGILRIDHPDILDFITLKSKPGALDNFNISVGVTDLVNPRTGTATKKLNAHEVFELIVSAAWQTGDPGLAFLDRINEKNPTPQIGAIESTNPCGEVPLLPYEACTLGSINLAKVVKNGEIDWEKLKELVHRAVHFLDNVVDASVYPLEQIEQAVHGNRKIGLGVMGFADMLIKLGIPYDSEEALATADRLMAFVSNEAKRTSQELADKRGPFPNFKGSIWDKAGEQPVRNATLTSIAPTGTISIIAGCSSGIEPLFAVAFVREVMEGTRQTEVAHAFEQVAKERGFYSRELMIEVARRGSIQNMDNIPEDVRNLFVTAFDVSPEWHVRMQATFQRHVDNAVSKTINLRHDATIGDVRNSYMLAYELGCKGITVYRYGSKPEQVLYIGPAGAHAGEQDEAVIAGSEYSGGYSQAMNSF